MMDNNSVIQIFILALVCAANSNEIPSNQFNTVLSIFNEYYISTLINTFNGEKPTNLRLVDDNEMYLKIGDASHHYKIGDKSTRKLKYNVTFESKKYLIDDLGNKVFFNEEGVTYLKCVNLEETLKVKTEGITTKQIAIDLSRTLVFVVAGPKDNKNFVGSLSVFNTKKPNRFGGRLVTTTIKNFKGRTLAIYVDKAEGTVLIALTEPSDQWSLTILKPIKSIVCKPPQNVKTVNKKVLLAAIDLAAENIAETYENAVLDKKIKNHGIDIDINNKNILYANAGSSRQVLGSKIGIIDEFQDSCSEELQELNEKLKENNEKIKNIEEEFGNFYSKALNSQAMSEITQKSKDSIDFSSIKKLKPDKVPKESIHDYICISESDLQLLIKSNKDVTKLLKDIESDKNSLAESINYQPSHVLDARFIEDK